MPESISTTNRLNGWAAIARYLRCDVTTAIRWARESSLPVYQPSGRRGAVHAIRNELDDWLTRSRNAEALSNHPSELHSKAGKPASLSSQEPVPATPIANVHSPQPPSAHSAPHKLTWLVPGALLETALGICAFTLAIFAMRQSPAALTASNPTALTRSRVRILSPLLSDGRNLFYPRYENGRYQVDSVSTTGGTSTDIDTGLANPELCDLSRDGQRLLLRNLVGTRDQLNPLYLQLRGSPAVRIGKIMAYDAAWFPDGKSILYSADGVVFSTDPSGKISHPLFRVPGNAYWFRWSPDSSILRFTVLDHDTEQNSLWEFKAPRNQPQKLFPHIANHLCCGSWSGNGQEYLFQARIQNRYEIWADHGGSGRLLASHDHPYTLISGAENYRSPITSPDGRRLFVRVDAIKGELVRYDSSANLFIPILPSLSVRTLQYSKDKKWIAYSSLTDNNLWRCRADGSDCLQLTKNFKNTVLPSWSPDGRTISFMGIGYTNTWGAYLVPANGGEVKSLTHTDYAEGYPDWSPNGDMLAFSEVPPISQSKGISILNLRTHQIHILPNSASYSYPRWSPNGRYIVAIHSNDQTLSLFDFHTGRWQLLADIPACYPNWSNDSAFVYFAPFSAANRAIFRVAIHNHKVNKISDLNGVERGSFFMGDWIGLAPDNSPLVIRNLSIEDIYAWNLIRH